MNKIITWLYRKSKKAYLKRHSSDEIELLWNVLGEVYSNPFMLQIISVEVENWESMDECIFTIYTKRPGLVIGTRGMKFDELEETLSYYFNKECKVLLKEVK